MADIEIRPLAVVERQAAANTIRAALLGPPTTEEMIEKRQASWDDSDALGAWDGDRCVGHLSTFRFQTTIPGGARVPTAGVTRVGVLPTHTRRGLLRRMMERSLREAHERGQILASLRASEGTIYGRFGFGLGGDGVDALITTASARPLRGQPFAGSVRVLTRDELNDTIPALYDHCARRRVGMIARPDWLWEMNFENVAKPSADHDARAREIAVHTDVDGVDDAYVHYQVGWDDTFADNPAASGKIFELFATSAEAERAMWAYVLDIDLVKTWQAPSRPTDDPIRRAFHDVRAYETKNRWDEQWIRLLDVDAALSARTYCGAAGSVVIEVVDPLLEANCGRWTISADGSGRTDAPADISVDITTASAAYLGGVSWSDLADAGEVVGDVDADVLTRLDGLFAVRPAPFCCTEF
jgi:predicted acetyltransferase